MTHVLGELASQLVLVALVLGAFAVGPGLAMAFLLVRRARLKNERRSPIGINLLRGPGHTLREQLEQESSEVIWDVMTLSVIPLILLALFLAQSHHRGGLDKMWHLAPLYFAAMAGGVMFVLRRMVVRGTHVDNLRNGYDAEVAIGQELDALSRRGALVFHDFPADGFNIDHVVLTPNCAYAVETKGYTKLNKIKGREGATVEYNGQTLRFPTWTTDEPLLQAERQAKWLADWIKKATGHSLPVHPVLALPGWFVKERGVGTVKVFSGKQLAALLDGPMPDIEPRLQSVTFQVEQRCRTVVPTYKRRGAEKS